MSFTYRIHLEFLSEQIVVQCMTLVDVSEIESSARTNAPFRWQRERCKFNNIHTSICDRAYSFQVRLTIHTVYLFERRLPEDEQLSLGTHQFIVCRMECVLCAGESACEFFH